ncbi:MAG: DMT family transporter, partial [Anaerolineae bacterium]
ERDLTIARRDWGLVLLLSFIGNLVYQILFINGLARSRASNTSLILSTSPIFVALVSTLTKTEKLSGRNWAGILLSFLGIFLLITGSNNVVAIDQRTLWGSVLVLCSTISWATYTVLLKCLVQRTSVIKATAWIMAATTPLLILAALPDLLTQDWRTISLGSWLGLFYSSAIAIGIGYVIWNTGVQRVGSVRTAVYSYFTPVISVVVAWIFLGENMQPVQALGALGILLGVWLGRSQPTG